MTHMTLLEKAQVLDKVSKNGKIFGVKFIKKNGQERIMNCRKGVKKYLRGGESTTAHLDNIVTVYSINDKGYRNINLDTLMSISSGGQEYKF